MMTLCKEQNRVAIISNNQMLSAIHINDTYLTNGYRNYKEDHMIARNVKILDIQNNIIKVELSFCDNSSALKDNLCITKMMITNTQTIPMLILDRVEETIKD